MKTDQILLGKAYIHTKDMRYRHIFSILSIIATVLLVGWGAFVTSINAGLAVPDWPTSFNSLDPFNPWPEWWKLTPVLAEHGHRLTGALVGLFTIVLAVWTWVGDERKWMKKLGVLLLVLVIFQGVLGGLRVNWVSLNLAVVHTCVAQLYFSLLVAFTLFTSEKWLRAEDVPDAGQNSRKMRTLALQTTLAIYVQIILGALLRHPGAGINPMLAGIHIGWAFLVVVLIIFTYRYLSAHFSDYKWIKKTGNVLLTVLVVQFTLGFTAYFVLLDESGVIRPSNLQVLVNSSHVVVGAFLLASSVVLTLLVHRRQVSENIATS